ncbi:uncharacterized protein LOC113336804 [Papaver somniferum]|uniref:uncharacterized protein LOC113336804 n=1 Tax=Papaver somniferum TaxID=3469 RepID=UPI000E6FD218|nr:uncharacterized protein LOC113336804 [Papaver somniferum]
MKRNNAFLVKEFSNRNRMVPICKEPNNFYNVNSFKHSGLANAKTVPIQAGNDSGFVASHCSQAYRYQVQSWLPTEGKGLLRTCSMNPQEPEISGNIFDKLEASYNLKGNLPVNILPVTYPSQSHTQAFSTHDDFPKTVTRKFSQGSSPTSMDFHPIQQTQLV